MSKWVWTWLAGTVLSWPLMLRAGARSAQGTYTEWKDGEDWALMGIVFLTVAAIWPVSVPFWLAVRWVRHGFERDEASKRNRTRSERP